MFGRNFQKSLNKVRDATRSKSQLEQQLKEALSKENWMPPNTLLQEIALTSEEAEDRAVIMKHVWDILAHGSASWRRTLKVLTLVEVLLKRGSIKIIADIHENAWKIAKWREERVMEQGKEVAGGIREKARIIRDLLENREELNRERQRNHELYERMAAVGCDPEQTNKKTLADRINNAVGGGGKQKLQEEINKERERAKEHIMVQEFCAETGASEQEARRFLYLSHGILKRAVAEYNRGGHRQTANQHQANGRPSASAAREMCNHVTAITMVSDRHAMKLLEQTRWDVAAAIDRACSSKGGNGTQELSTTASSGSASESSGSESDDGAGTGPARNQGRNSGGPAFGAMPKNNGWPSPKNNGWPSPNNNGWPTPSSNGWATPPEGMSPRGAMSPRANASPFEQHGHYASGKGTGHWPMQPGNPFSGKGFGKGGPNESFSAQYGGFPASKGAAFGPQAVGGKGGYAGGQQAASTGYNNSFGWQKGGFNGQMRGTGFGGQDGAFYRNASANNPFGNF